MVNWDLIKSLLFTLGPLLLPKAIAFVRSIRASSHRASIRPCPSSVNRALNIIFVIALLALVSTLPYFSPENVFLATSSRLQIPTEVLFTRLAGFKGTLTPFDEALRAKFVNLESRLLYFKYGPDALATCSFCTSEDENSYILYYLPTLFAPHIVHLIALGLATSGLLFGPEASRWRTQAAVAGATLALGELWLTLLFDHRANSKATKLGEIDFFYWRMRILRYLTMAAVDALLGWAIWLTATNRWLVQPPKIEVQLEESLRVLEGAQGKLTALGAIRNTVFRDRVLREQLEKYWTEEGTVMADVHEDKEVVDSTRDVLEKVNVDMIEQRAKMMTENMLGSEGPLKAFIPERE